MSSTPIYPPPLKPGDTIALVAPASSPLPDAVASAVQTIEVKGYRTKQYRPLTEPMGYLSGSDEVRAEELMQAFGDPEVAAIFAVRGGYGVARMLPRLDFAAVGAHPKLVAGYSDITALHVALDKLARLVSYHAPNAIDTRDFDQLSSDAFWRAVTEPPIPRELLAGGDNHFYRTITPGVAEGRLIGGNLAVFTSLVGGPFDPDTTGRILFLEDTGEAPYRIDRMLLQLKQSGKLDAVAGVVLGHFTDCEPPGDHSGSDGPTSEQVLQEYFAELRVPVLAGFPAGHAAPNITLPHAAGVKLNATTGSLTAL